MSNEGHESLPATFSTPSGDIAPPGRWWETFGSEELNEIVDFYNKEGMGKACEGEGGGGQGRGGPVPGNRLERRRFPVQTIF